MNIKWAVNRSVYLNTKIIILLHLKGKQEPLVEFSHFGDPLGGHLGFRGEAKGKQSPSRVILQLNILNYHKMKKKSGILTNRLIIGSMKQSKFGQKPLSFGHMLCIVAAILIIILSIFHENVISTTSSGLLTEMYISTQKYLFCCI